MEPEHMTPWAVVIAVGLFAASVAGSFSAGMSQGISTRDAHWQRALDASNAKANAAIAAAGEIVAQRDRQVAAVLASQKDIQDAADAQLETLRQQIPVSADCSRCTIDARRLRQGSAAADHRQTRLPASGAR